MQREEAIPLETSDGYPVTELVRAIDARLHGPADLRIAGVNNLERAEPGDLALLASHRLMDQALHSRASAFIVPQYFPDLNGAQLVSAHPQFDFVRLITQFFTKPRSPAGIAETVVKGSNVRLGPRRFHRTICDDWPSNDHRGSGDDLPRSLFRRRRHPW